MKSFAKYIVAVTAIPAAALLSFSCGKFQEPAAETPEEGTVLFTVTPSLDMEVDVSEGRIPVKSDGTVIGQRDIWCFIYDADGDYLLDGFPVRQNEIIGSTYTFAIPTHSSPVNMFFAVMPDNVSYSYDGYSLNFSGGDIFGENNGLWCSDSQYFSSIESSEDGISLGNIILEQRHDTFEIILDFTNFPMSPDEFISGVSFAADDAHYPSSINLLSFEAFTDEDYTVKYRYSFNVLYPEVSLYNMRLYLTTARDDIFKYEQIVYPGNDDLYRMEFEVDYNRINGYYD